MKKFKHNFTYKMKLSYFCWIFSFLFFVSLSRNVYSFDLCPACSPETVSEEEKIPSYMLNKGKFSIITLYSLSEIKSNHTKGHSSEIEQALISSNYGVSNRFKAGLMYGFSSEKLSLQMDWLLLQEKGHKPSLILGIGSFRGVFSESHPYIIAMKSLQSYMKLPIKISLGIKHKGDNSSEFQLEPVGNLIFRIYRSVYLMAISEGQEFDLAIYGILFDRLIFGLRMVELKTPALGIVVRI